jgi:hypothetical protein
MLTLVLEDDLLRIGLTLLDGRMHRIDNQWQSRAIKGHKGHTLLDGRMHRIDNQWQSMAIKGNQGP